MQRDTVTVEGFYTRHADALQLRLVAGANGLKRIIREPTSEYPDTLMPPFAERLSEQQLNALVQYLANRH